MKAHIIIFATALIFSSVSAIAQPVKSIIIKDARGIEYVQPVKAEKVVEELPPEVTELTNMLRQSIAAKVFDLTELSKPEAEEPLPFDLQTVLGTAKK